ncbi:MAG: GNAT family N-acetyltransferase [Chthonomonadales bacterium]
MSDTLLNNHSQFASSNKFCFHIIDLRPSLETVYGSLHNNCVRRKIKRAEREKLTYECGGTDELLRKFWHLLLLTRRRHQLPPQPPPWFHNMLRCLGDQAIIHVASKDGVPVASILTLRHKARLIYKYGCSDAKFNAMGGTPLLFWKVIQQAHSAGIEEFDLGRSSFDDLGLIDFKGHLGATPSDLIYYRNPPPSTKPMRQTPLLSFLPRQALAKLPDPLFAGVGRLLYRHMG